MKSCYHVLVKWFMKSRNFKVFDKQNTRMSGYEDIDNLVYMWGIYS